MSRLSFCFSFRWSMVFPCSSCFLGIDNGENKAYNIVKRSCAWGNLLEEPTNGVLLANPFRYRGYYYDTSIGLYYLNSRYYDPETGRFLNEDLVSYLEPETIGGINLYTYCLNDPVNYIDPTGHFPALLLSVLISMSVSLLAETASDLLDDGKLNSNLNDYLGAAVSGAIAGLGRGLISTALLSGIGEVLSQTFITNEINGLGEAASVFAITAFSSAVGYGIGKGVQRFGGNAKFKSIIGNSTKNLAINNKLANAGYKQLKIGVLGKSGVVDGIIQNSRGLRIVDDLVENGFGFVISVRWW